MSRLFSNFNLEAIGGHRLLLGPHTISRRELLLSLKISLKNSPLTWLRGGKKSGKSTTALLYAQNLLTQGHPVWISDHATRPVTSTLRELISELNNDSQSPTQATFIIDDIDALSDLDENFEALLHHCKEHRIVCFCLGGRLPAVSPDLFAQFKILNAPLFTSTETSELVDALVPHAQSPLFFELSGGHPWLLAHAAGSLIQSGEGTATIASVILSAQRKYAEWVVQEMLPHERQAFLQAMLVVNDRELRDLYLSKVPRHFRFSISEAKLSDSLLTSSLSSQESLPAANRVLELLKSRTTSAARLDEIRLLIALGRAQDAVAVVQLGIHSLFKDSAPKAFQEALAPIIETAGAESKACYAYVLYHLGSKQEAVEFLRLALISEVDVDSRATIITFLARMLRNWGRAISAKEYLSQLKASDISDPFIRVRFLREVVVSSDLPDVPALILAARADLPQVPADKRKLILGLLDFAEGTYYRDINELDKSQEFLNRATLNLEGENIFDRSYCAVQSALTAMAMRNTQKVAVLFHEWETVFLEQGLSSNLEEIGNIYGFTLLFSGEHEKLQTLLSNPRYHASWLWVLRRQGQFAVRRGDPQTALKTYQLLAQHPDVGENRVVRTYYEAMVRVLQNLSGNSNLSAVSATIDDQIKLLSEEFQLYFWPLCLELSWTTQLDIPFRNIPSLDTIEKLSRYDMPFGALLYLFSGLHHLLQRGSLEARKHFDRALSISSDARLTILQLRTLLFVSIDLIMRREESAAQVRLEECKLLATQLSSVPEASLIAIIEVLIGFRTGQRPRNPVAWDGLFRSPYGGLAKLLAEHMQVPVALSEGAPLTRMQRKLADLLGIPLNLEVSVKFRGRVKVSTPAEAKKLAQSKQFAIVLDHTSGYIRVGSESFTESQRPAIGTLVKILVELQGKAASREMLCNRIWTEDYHPFTHDPRLATLLNRLRSWARGSGYTDFIETVPTGFLLRAEVSTLIVFRKEITGAISASQQWILDHLSNTSTIQRSKVVEVMKCSVEKAKRDLGALVQKGLIVQHGRGRGAHYRTSNEEGRV